MGTRITCNYAVYGKRRVYNTQTAAALRIFVPTILKGLGFDTEDGFPWDPLKLLTSVSYSESVRLESGIPVNADYPQCGKPSASEKQLAKEAALGVVARFKQFDKDLIVLYILPYLENIVSRVAGSSRDVPEILGLTLGFIE